jgi:RNA-directed DNA polymerase
MIAFSGGGAPSVWRGRLWRSARRSGVTPGTIVSCAFQRVRLGARLRTTPHAGQDGLEPPPLSSINRARLSLLRGLAEALLAGSWDLDGLVERGGRLLGRRYRWLRPLARRVLEAFPGRPRPRVARLAEFLWTDERFRKAWRKHAPVLHFNEWPVPGMSAPPGPPASWPVPAITTSAELARFLELEPNQLDWFADCQTRERSAPVEPLRHYRYHWVAKPSDALRLIEAPKPRLKHLQRRLLDEILSHIPPHEAAHGFRPGRSVTTFVAPHVGRTILLKMDLRDFFVSITSARVLAIFLTAGYPEPVARLLTGLCTNTVPLAVWNQSARVELDPARSPTAWQARRLYRQPHLPQGAPTSPALANLAAHRLDARLAGLAKAANASFTRYADDLVFSGGEAFARSIARFPIHAAAIALEEGFDVQHRKTRIMRQGVRQRAAGVVINQKINITRDDFDHLKAILYNCACHGPEGQNRAGVADFRAHLAGRVAHAARLNPERGEKLMRLFEGIVW